MSWSYLSGDILRAKPCAYCTKPFTPLRPLQAVCGPVCARKKVLADKAKGARELRQRKEANKSRTEWLAEAQTVLNRYVRLRDARKGCASCDRPATWDGQWHASHFRSVGAASALRFNLWNVHKACSICNNHLSGNLAGYRPRLIERIGQHRVDWLETQNHLVRHDVDYLKRLKAVFAKKARRLERRA